MQLQEIIDHPSGVWAAAKFIEEHLSHYAGHPLTGGHNGSPDNELPRLMDELRHFLYRMPPDEYTVASVRQLAQQVLALAAEAGLPCCDLRDFTEWLDEHGDIETRIEYTLAALDALLDEFAWMPNMEIKEAGALRKNLQTHWKILSGLQDMATTGAMGPTEDIELFDMMVRGLLAQAKTLIAAYESA